MLEIPGYEIHEKLYEGGTSLVLRALRKEDNTLVIIKFLVGDKLSPERVARFKREAHLIQLIQGVGVYRNNLKHREFGKEAPQNLDSERATIAERQGASENPNCEAKPTQPKTDSSSCFGICKLFKLEKVEGTYAMILEDIGGRSLNEILASRRLTVKESLQIVIQIVATLARIHEKPVIHKDINPKNIIWNSETGKVQLVNFSIASTLPREMPIIVNPKLLEGTLEYISPEQTGRMNRAVDERTDYYSLGVTLYEMLTGSKPFKSDDPLELIHLHMTKQPKPPSALDANIPEVLSNIVLKMMAKVVEERYQGARGLEFDLSKCLDSLNKTEKIDLFPIGTHDISDRFQISGKLYDRWQELNQLRGMFLSVSKGEAGFLLVSGPSGAGKTALILELHKTIVEKKGFFIGGKFELAKQNNPYWGIIKALEEWVKQIVLEGASSIADWKQTLLAAVGTNGGIVTELIPAFEQILGPQSKPLAVSATEGQERFNLVFVKFIQALGSSDHPLVLFLDDLQWADFSSLRIIKEVIFHRDSKYLMLIGACRSDAENIKTFVKEDLGKAGHRSEMIALPPLPFEDLWQMSTDSLQTMPDLVRLLVEICYSHSQGNPFFFIQILKYFHQKKWIHLDKALEHWQWDIEQIKQEELAENIHVLMSDKIRKLAPATQEVIQAAACIDYHFDLQTLAFILNKTVEETLNALWEALQEELITPKDQAYKYIPYLESGSKEQNAHFRFAHDSIHLAAYEMLPKQKQEEFHYQIAQFLLKTTPKEKWEENIFTIVNQFNFGKRVAISDADRLSLIKLNLQAGVQAKNSAAFPTGAGYLQIAKKELGEDSWGKQYELTLSISKNLAECFYNTGQILEADELMQSTLSNVKTDLEKSELYVMQGTQLAALGFLARAIDCGIAGLNLFNMTIPKNPSKMLLLKEFILARYNLGRRSISSLIDLPRIVSPELIQQIKLLNLIPAAAFYVGNPDLLALSTLKSVSIGMRNGNVEELASAYSAFGMILHSFYALKDGEEFMKLGVALNEKFNDIRNQAEVLTIYGVFGFTFEAHWKKVRGILDKAIEAGLKAGSTEWLMTAATQAVVWDPEMPRSVFLQEEEKYASLIDRKRYPYAWDLFKIVQHYHGNLAGISIDRFSMSGPTFDEYLALQELKNVNNNSAMAVYYNGKAYLSYIYGNFMEALVQNREASKHVSALVGSPSYTEYCFYSFLIRIQVYSQLHWQEKVKAFIEMRSYLWKMRKWAAYCPMNFIHKQFLMEAELARFQRKKKKAAKLYQKAIESAKKYEFLNIEAIATELAAKFYLADNQLAVARTLMHEAYYAYHKYGSMHKLKELSESYPDLLSEAEISNVRSVSSITHPTAETTAPTLAKTIYRVLDVNTIVKASQAISGEIELGKLIKNMMHIAIESAGAEKGWLILEKGGTWTVEGAGTLDKVDLTSQPIDLLPQSMINSVIHSKTALVFSNPAWLGQFASDAYIQRVHPKSALCMPLLNRDKLSGVLYLENNLTTDAFTPEYLEVLNLLGSQIAISIDNAKLYTDLLNLNESLKTLKESISRFIPNEFLDVLGKENVLDIKLGDCVEKDMTLLFVNIPGLASQLKKMTLQAGFKFFNEFLGVMVPVIRGQQGFIDKYLENGFIALFPTDADAALLAAVGMLRALKDYNSKLSQNQVEGIQMGIALNSGKVILGTVGEEGRLDGTVISDVVNTASRLLNETINYAVPLLISKGTYTQLKNPEHHDMRCIDTIKLRGKSEPITIYEVFEADSPQEVLLKRQSREDFEKGVSLFYEAHYEEALALFNKITRDNPSDLPAAKFLARIKGVLHNPNCT